MALEKLMMKDDLTQLFRQHFGTVPEVQAFAPGRIEFIGNHTDYNGGLVMGVAVTEGITVAVRKREDRLISITSDGLKSADLSLDRLLPASGAAAWTNYPVGVTKVLLEKGMKALLGYDMLVQSTLPAGAGMSSSAAFELATAYALAELYGFESDRAGFARIGREAENDFVGLPCGILDQGVSAFGKANHIVKIDCATEAYSLSPMPKGVHFWILNSNKKHALVDSAYAERHRECREALAIVQQTVAGIDNLSAVTGDQLLDARDRLGDRLFRRALHVVGENTRVRAVEAALRENDLRALGKLLFASHESSRLNFENSTQELDFIVDALRGSSQVYGARLTGGGFGGAVMAMTNDQFDHSSIKAAYEKHFSRELTVFHTRAGEGARLLSHLI